jgi:hypothetical protein
MSSPVVAIGFLLLIPSLAGIRLAAFPFFIALMKAMEGNGLGATVGGWMSLAIAVPSFIGGLLGWLLIMRKRILMCSACGATVTAS